MSVYSARASAGQSPVRERRATAGSARRRAAYAAAGVAVGAVWAFGGDTPAWEHAVRVLLVVLCVSVAGRLVGSRLARTGRAPLDRSLFLGLVAAKVLLVAVALLVDQVAGLWFAEPALVTAAILSVVVAVGGPALHGRLSRAGDQASARPCTGSLVE
ncbi:MULTISPECIES: hypothetical protein [Streptomyces]|uniref:hypothetical protein n=1 Tax=Streptomyces TaxID=1883 RepID=UPI00075EFB09|nr:MULTISPECIES: hypothetical protein [unclassified Streptomyces]AQT75745.1 hypothetical protein B1K54_32760 [Streptomyces sp. fd1-xmd]MDX6764397.1 hypothetical protein [Streptomyces sp. F8]